MEKRNIEKHIKFNQREYNAVCQKSAYLKMRVGTYLRTIAVQGEIKVYSYKEIDSVKRALNKIGVNINQIVTVINNTGSVYQKDMEDLQSEFNQMKIIVENWLSPLTPEEIL